MLINPQNMAMMLAGMTEIFDSAKKAAALDYVQLVMIRDHIDQESFNVGEMLDLAGVREWIGPRIPANLLARKMKFDHKPWEKSFTFLTEQLRRWVNPLVAMDQIGPNIRNLLPSHEVHKQDYVYGLLADAPTIVGIDGQMFADTDHPYDLEGTDTWSNLWTDEFTYDIYVQALSHAYTLRLYNGTPIVLKPVILQCAPGKVTYNEKIVYSETIPGGAGEKNPYQNRVKVVPNARLTGEEWIMIFEFPGLDMKPVLISHEKYPELQSNLMQQTADFFGAVGLPDKVYSERAVGYGTEAWYVACLTAPELILYSTGTNA